MISPLPSVLIQELISERENRRDSVADEISQMWGKEQTIIGPIITIPYRHQLENGGQIEQTIRYANFLPEELHIKGTIVPEVRYRGIYKVIVYNSKLSISGFFSSINFSRLNVPLTDFMIDDAFVSIGISDMTGIQDAININWDNEEYFANPGIASNDVLASGVSISPDLDAGKVNHFDIEIDLNGSSGIRSYYRYRNTSCSTSHI